MNTIRTKGASVKPGDVFGRLIVIGQPFFIRRKSSTKRRAIAVCECECHRITAVECSHLKGGLIRSCGCLRSDTTRMLASQRNRTHGLSTLLNSGTASPYENWKGMRSRCLNDNYHASSRYKGRGITICEEWIEDAKAFCNWAYSNGWKPGMTLDRIDNDGNYCPENCQFLTKNQNVSKQAADRNKPDDR